MKYKYKYKYKYKCIYTNCSACIVVANLRVEPWICNLLRGEVGRILAEEDDDDNDVVDVADRFVIFRGLFISEEEEEDDDDGVKSIRPIKISKKELTIASDIGIDLNILKNCSYQN